MNESANNRDTNSLSPRAIRLRDRCLGALSRRSSMRAPNAAELAKIRTTLGLPEAWYWWSHLETPTETVRTISVGKTTRSRQGNWRGAIITVLATGAWLITPIAAAVATTPSRIL